MKETELTKICFHCPWPCLLCLCPCALPPWSSPCSCWRPLMGTTLTTGCWWNSLLLFIKQSAFDLFILTPSFTCLAIDDWKVSSTFIENSASSLSCSSMQCFQRAFSGSFDLNPAACSLPLVKPFAPVSPSYSDFLPARRLYSYVLWWESSLCKTPHFQWIYGKLNQIYEKLRSDQMDPKSALGGPKPISRTGGSLLKNWSYTSNQCIYFSILLDWRSHLAKTLFILH